METPRRVVLAAGAAMGAAAWATGCGGGDSSPEPSDTTGESRSKPPSTEPPSAATETGEPSASAGDGQRLAKTSEIPVGGGKIFDGPKVVVTQPTAGEFKAFSAVCTHQGCIVDKVADGTIDCPCHGSLFRISDASVARGPATRPLARRQITVTQDSILLV
ncbi:Rieske (2Fe-2S) protein [Streptomyces albipurpureus]|uniref:Cytochrome bc1 complex Rieske iron-sulfur subunit n=1 Tax=Streptomyces albipurpureus TaxID=2897419 RepID=A0ABT0UXI1_9ACTN|nr:Rieske (2Fe-2S) protein [Streptomyces sp. CWNU-1]MCM2393180.1 Rieske (2Fe-2S) protein [Streptomyces sp. CWNU-1]